jgi:subtilisin family serine protease
MSKEFRKITAGVAVAAALCAATLAAAAPVPTPDDPQPALSAAKSGHAAKLGPWLANLDAEYKEAVAKGTKSKSFKSQNKALRVSGALVSIDAVATNGAALEKSLRGLGATQITRVGPLVAAKVPIAALDRIAALPTLRYAKPVLAGSRVAVSQGDVTLNGPAARAGAGVDGSGVRVGIISDSYTCNPPAFLPGAPTTTFQQDLGVELPTDSAAIAEGPCPLSDEGRGMGQIVHDVAPGASQRFHTAYDSQLDFAEGILELAAAGSKVIVDDIIYFAEPMFSDGMVGQAVDLVTAQGVSYFSSAGNQARQSYEDEFRGVNVLTNAGKNLNGGKSTIRRFHDFDPGPGISILQPVVVESDGEAALTIVAFQWDQPFLSATTYARVKAGQDPALAVGATSDLDLVFFDRKGHVVPLCPPGVSRGITCQITGDRNIGGDAGDVGIIYTGRKAAAQLFYVGLVVAGGPDPQHVKYVWNVDQGNFGVLAFDTQSGSAYGHSNAKGTISIGAASWYATVPFSTSGLVPPNDTQSPPIDLSPCAPGCLNDFSSAGNIPTYFDRFGNRLPTPERRYNPSVTGPDGGNSSFFLSDSSYDDDDGDGLNSPFSTFISGLDDPADELPNFFGTSASAPHVAAVAALMLQKDPSLTPAQVRSILEQTARPIDRRFISNRPIIFLPITPGPDGYNDDAGVGLVDAEAALEQTGN